MKLEFREKTGNLIAKTNNNDHALFIYDRIFLSDFFKKEVKEFVDKECATCYVATDNVKVDVGMAEIFLLKGDYIKILS